MTSDRFRPVVAIEVTGLLGYPLPPSIDTRFLAGTGAEITFHRESFPARFLSQPRWDERGEHVERWAFLGRGVSWVQELLHRGIEVVWASRYQEITNAYFGSPLHLPELPVAAIDDRQVHTTEAEWKARQLGKGVYADRPLLWVNDVPAPAGRSLIDRLRTPDMHALTAVQFIRGAASNVDVQVMNQWLGLASSPVGQRELRTMRERMALLHRTGFSNERTQRRWLLIRTRLESVVDFRSSLVGPLAAYAVEHVDELDLRVIARIREVWGLPVDPSAEELLTHLKM